MKTHSWLLPHKPQELHSWSGRVDLAFRNMGIRREQNIRVSKPNMFRPKNFPAMYPTKT